jgi:AraC family transcriptional regulator, dual regulator of chb operon
MHGHDFAEVFWIESGHGVHEIDPRSPARQVDLGPGSIALVGPDDAHAIRVLGSGELVLVNVAFSRDRLAAIVHDFGTGSGYRALTAMKTSGCLVSTACLRELSSRFAALAVTDLRRLALDRFLLEVLSDVERDLDAGERAKRLPHWLATAIDVARGDLEVLAEGSRGLAAIAGRSVDHLNRTCRRFLGTTASVVVNRLRLENAEHLLRTTSLSITEVAYSSGFGNLSYFYRLFRERAGCSPRRFREINHVPVRVS